MDKLPHVSATPHIHSGRSTQQIMRDVIIALLHATVAGALIFGPRALLVVAVTTAACVLFEFLFNMIVKKDQTIGDLSAAVTGLLLGLNLPVSAPIWQCIVGALFAIIVVKCLFGGIGYNLVNPAITARVFMLVAFGGSMANHGQPFNADTASSATPLAVMADGGSVSLTNLLLGTVGGTIGETCAVALLAGFAYLLIRRIISWHIPVAYIGTVFILSLLAHGFDVMHALSYILSGGLILGAVFMATDYVTSPPTPNGKLLFGLGAGLLTFLIRDFGVYPEGVSFAILFMNILTPYIERLTAHKVFGGSAEK